MATIDGKKFSMQEASQHSSKNDCWIVIDGKVYDVSSYLDEHPGGDDVVLEVTGKDATDEFEDAGHSDEARELLETFFIGELNTSPSAIPDLEIHSKKDYGRKIMDLSKLYWPVPVAVLGVAVVVGFLVLKFLILLLPPLISPPSFQMAELYSLSSSVL